MRVGREYVSEAYAFPHGFGAGPPGGVPRTGRRPVARCPAYLRLHLPAGAVPDLATLGVPWGGGRSGTAEADPRRGSPQAGGTTGRCEAARRVAMVCGHFVGPVWGVLLASGRTPAGSVSQSWLSRMACQ